MYVCKVKETLQLSSIVSGHLIPHKSSLIENISYANDSLLSFILLATVAEQPFPSSVLFFFCSNGEKHRFSKLYCMHIL